MHRFPETYLLLQEQDRERAATKQALERAARSGGEQRPGLARGGLTGFARVLRGAAFAVTHIGQTGRSGNTSVTGPSGI